MARDLSKIASDRIRADHPNAKNIQLSRTITVGQGLVTAKLAYLTYQELDAKQNATMSTGH
jgi:hypothetical protein